MLRPTNPTQIRNRILHPIDLRSVREGFAPFTATVPLGTNDTPSELDRRLIKSGITVEDGKWNPPSLRGNTQRSCGRGAAIDPSAEESRDIRRKRRNLLAGNWYLLPPLHRCVQRSSAAGWLVFRRGVVSTEITCGSLSRAGRSLRQRRPAFALLRRLRPAYNHTARTPLFPVGLDGMTGKLRHAFNHILRTSLRNPKTDPTGLIKSNGSVADAAPSSPCRGRRPLSHRRSAGHPPDR